jgi:hypothetical protein
VDQVPIRCYIELVLAGLYSEIKQQDLGTDHCLYLMLKLRISGVIPPFPAKYCSRKQRFSSKFVTLPNTFQIFPVIEVRYIPVVLEKLSVLLRKTVIVM